MEQTVTIAAPRKYKPVWSHIIVLTALHLAGFYGAYLIVHAKIYTVLQTIALYEVSMLGITAGVHRLFAHRSYKAKLPLKLLLVFAQTLAQQGSIIGWCHNHRVHHKYSDTDADPHNAQRGLFYSHIGWLMVQYHPHVLEKRKTIDMSDLTGDPILAFQKKYFLILMPLTCFIVPSIIPVYFWGENMKISIFVNVFRYLVAVHCAFIINSWAHTFGTKPYDSNILPVENLLCSIISHGEGYHNYHHAFPWDYKAAELAWYRSSWTTAFIDLMAKIGWAYDLKTASDALIQQKIQNRGDGTHPTWKTAEEKE